MITQRSSESVSKQNEVIEAAVSYAMSELITHLKSASIACIELAYRLQSANVTGTRRDEATQAACQVLSGYPLDVAECVHDACIECDLPPDDDEQLVASVRAEVSRRVDGLIALLG